MMAEDELNDLAADIRENGLIHPIVVDADGQLIDGRNRLEACQRASVEPKFVTLPPEQDPREFIGSVNDGKRRRMTQGQIAMCYVEMYWDESLCKLHKGQHYVAQKAGVQQATLARACIVKNFTPLAVPGVKSGATPLSTAYEAACEEKKRLETEEEKQERLREKFSRLQSEAPDIASMVQEERLSLAGALAELQERHRQEEQRLREQLEARQRVSRRLETALAFFDPAHMDPVGVAEHFLQERTRGSSRDGG